ncbi:hypothetical protein GCM10020001_055220 [Nonomuraea salmonea]
MSRSAALVDADWVEANLDTPGVVLVEVDEDVSAYDKGHIRGAVKVDWRQDLQDPVRRDFVDKTGFEALLSDRGISNDDTVVLYGGNNNWFAAYAYWYFKLYGHANVKLLDGGRKKWELDSRELVRDVPQRPKTQYVAKDQDTAIRAFRDDVVSAIGKLNLVDVRSPDEFTGKLLAPRPPAAGAGAARRPRADGPQHPVVQGGQRRRHLQVRRRPARPLPGGRGRLRQGHHRLLPHRRAVGAHLVRAPRDPGAVQREELRRFVDRIRLARGRADRAGGGPLMSAQGCGGAGADRGAARRHRSVQPGRHPGRRDRRRHRLRAAARPLG